MLLLAKLAIGAFMIALTVGIHAVACDYVFSFIENHARSFAVRFHALWKIWALIVAVFMIGGALMIDIWLWTILFLTLEPDVLKDIDTALYFTTITFTTVGFGDVVLHPEWRLLSASTAINGMLLFGWSTAFIFEIMTVLYRPSDKNWHRAERHQRHLEKLHDKEEREHHKHDRHKHD